MSRKRNLLTAILLSSAPAAASPHAPQPPADAQVAPALRALRVELIKAGRDNAQAELAKFRPLCDKDGYPLVGNIANKGDRYQPSQFCSDLRKREQK